MNSSSKWRTLRRAGVGFSPRIDYRKRKGGGRKRNASSETDLGSEVESGSRGSARVAPLLGRSEGTACGTTAAGKRSPQSLMALERYPVDAADRYWLRFASNVRVQMLTHSRHTINIGIARRKKAGR